MLMLMLLLLSFFNGRVKGATQVLTGQILNPSVNSMAYAHVLRHRIAALLEKRSVCESLKPGGALWGSLVLFLETADPVQLRYVGAEWRRLVEFTEQIARAAGSVRLAGSSSSSSSSSSI